MRQKWYLFCKKNMKINHVEKKGAIVITKLLLAILYTGIDLDPKYGDYKNHQLPFNFCLNVHMLQNLPPNIN